jgi:membrane protein YdbS with pleckstrin-like domain
MLAMSLREKNLVEGEDVVMELHEHAKAVAWPFVLLLLLIGAVGAAFLLSPDPVVVGVVAAVAVVVAAVWVVVPWLRWRTTSYTVTTQRIAMRSGILTRVGRDIPLYRINDLALEKDLLDRVLGCGTLVVSDATEKQGMVLRDVPRVDDVHVQLQELLFAMDDGSDDGEWPPTEPLRRRR